MSTNNLSYGVDSRPPWLVTLGSAVQHIGLGSIILVFPVLVADAAHVSEETTQAMVVLSCLVLGIATLLQVMRLGPVGSGFLIPAVFTAAYLPASIEAAEMGGLGAVFGMTIFAGLVEIVLSRFLERFRAFLPPELSGFVVLYIGLILGLLGFRLAVGVTADGHPETHTDAAVHAGAFVTLLVTTGLNVWGKGKARMFCALIGLVFGYAVFKLVAPLEPAAYYHFGPTPHRFFFWKIDWPLAIPSFEPTLALGFVVGAIAAMLRAAGDIITSQKMNDPGWTQPESASIYRGVLADGIGTVVAGLIGTLGINTYSGSVGLANATGVTARVVGVATGILWIVLAFLPATSAVIVAIPKPVLGAALFFVSTFIVANGLQIIAQRALDNRKIIVIGVSLFLGLSRDVFPEIWVHAPALAHVFTQSSLVVAVLSALILTALFRIGVARRLVVALDNGPDAHAAAAQFLTNVAQTWSTRNDVVYRATAALDGALRLAARNLRRGERMQLIAMFDDFDLKLKLRYRGSPLPANNLSELNQLSDRSSHRAGDKFSEIILRFRH
jgi:xanthine/uracil permease